MLRLLRSIGLPQMRASWGRTALVAGGIATGVALIVAIHVVNASVLGSFRRTIELVAGPAALEVTVGTGEVGFPETVVELVRQDPAVALAVPLVRGTVALADAPADALHLFGADLVAEEALARYQVRAVTDRRDLLRMMEDPRALLLTTELAAAEGLAVGDAVEVSTPTGVVPLTLRGLLEVEGVAAALGGRIAVMDLPAAQMLLARGETIDQIDVVLHPDAALDAVQARLQGRLPAGLRVATPEQRGRIYADVLMSFQAMLTGLSTICLVAGLFIVYNTTATGALERTRSLGCLRALGAEGRQIGRLLLLEAALLGAAGTALGVGAGLVLARLLTRLVTESMGVVFQLRFPVEELTIAPADLALAAALGIGTALFAASFAARRAARLDPLDVMEARHGAAPHAVRMAPLWASWAVLVAVSIAALLAQERLKSIFWGNVGSTLWNASVIVIAIPLVVGSRGVLHRVLPRLFRAEGRFATESLARAPVRAGVTVAAIALVITLAMVIATLPHCFLVEMIDYIGTASGDLVVSAVTTEGGWMETPLAPEVAEELAAIDGVRAIERLQVVPGQLYRGERIGLLGLDPVFFTTGRYPAHWFREGDPDAARAAMARGTGVGVSTGFADRFGLRAGDTVALETPTGPVALPIVGVVTDYVSNRGSVVLSRELLAERWLQKTLFRVNVFAAPGVALPALRERIVARFADRHRLKILALPEVLDYHRAVVRRAFAFTDTMQLLLVIVTVAGIFDLLLSAVLARRRELALWRMIGAETRRVRRAVVIEAATIGLMGATLGVLVGSVTAWIWVRLNFRYLLGYFLPFHYPWTAALWFATLVLVMTVLAGRLAAVRATRDSILGGIRAE